MKRCGVYKFWLRKKFDRRAKDNRISKGRLFFFKFNQSRFSNRECREIVHHRCFSIIRESLLFPVVIIQRSSTRSYIYFIWSYLVRTFPMRKKIKKWRGNLCDKTRETSRRKKKKVSGILDCVRNFTVKIDYHPTEFLLLFSENAIDR